MTADGRLRIGAWAAVAAALLGAIVILAAFGLSSRFDGTTVTLVLASLRVVAMLVAVIGLRELLDHLSRNTALVVLAAGVIGCLSSLVAVAIVIVDGPIAVARILSLAAGPLVAVWIAGTGVALGRGNGGRVATFGLFLGGTLLVTQVAVQTGLTGAAPVGGWNLLLAIAQVAYLVLLARFALAALRPDPGIL